MLERGDDQGFEARAEALIESRFQDASEPELPEQLVRLQDIRWQFAIEGAGDGVWDWNVSDSRVFFSKQWKAMRRGTDRVKLLNGRIASRQPPQS